MRPPALMVVAALAAATAMAHASTLTFGSYVGSSASGLDNNSVSYSNTMGSGAVVGYDNPSYGAPFSGTQFVSYTTSTDATSNYTTAYTTWYTGALAGATADLSLLADNSATVYLNSVLVGSYGDYRTPGTLTLPSSAFVNGINYLTFIVLNDDTGGPTAFDFSATIAPAPEPSTIALIGTGLVGLAWATRQRRMALRAAFAGRSL